MTVRGFLVALALLASAEPSTALACHRYSIWKNPWPQRCGVSSQGELRHLFGHNDVVAKKVEPKDWYVEIVLTPQVLDEISHGVGIEKIKQLQGERP